MAAGPRSLLAFWIGGAGAGPQQAGVRGLLAPWIGGAAAPPAAPDQGGMCSLLAFWMGGAAPGPFVPPPELQPIGGGMHRIPLHGRRRHKDTLILLVTAALHIIDPPS